MAISQVGAHTTDSVGSGTSVSPAAPTGIVAGDVLVACVTQNNQTVTKPSGWVLLDGLNASGTTGNVWASAVYYKICGSSEPSTYTWSIPAAAPFVVSIDAWRGVDTTNPIAGHAATINGTVSEPHTGPSVTVSTATDGLLFYVRAVRFAGTTVPTLSTTDGTVFRHWSEGIFSGGTVCYAHSQFSGNNDFTGTGTYTGLAVSCSSAESDNFEATFALQALNIAAAGSDTGSAIDSAGIIIKAIGDAGSGADVGIHTVPVDSGTFAESAIIGTAHQSVSDTAHAREFASAGQVGKLTGPRVASVAADIRTLYVPSQTDDSTNV